MAVSRRSSPRSARLPEGVWLGSTADGACRAARSCSSRLDEARAATPGPLPRSMPRSSPTASCSTLEPGVALDRPIEIVHLAARRDRRSRAYAQPRDCSARAAARRILETYAGDGSYWRNDVVESAARRRSRAEFMSGSHWSRRRPMRSHHRSQSRAVLGPAARLDELRPDCWAARLSRHESTVRSDGRERALPARRRLSACRGRAGGDHRYLRRSRGARRQTRELFKGVVDGARARRLPGPHRRSAGRAEDRRAAAEPQPAAEPARRDRHQARARNPTPTTSNAATAPRSAISTRRRSSICAPAASRRTRRGGC